MMLLLLLLQTIYELINEIEKNKGSTSINLEKKCLQNCFF